MTVDAAKTTQRMPLVSEPFTLADTPRNTMPATPGYFATVADVDP
jgi:hypothetical protein